MALNFYNGNPVRYRENYSNVADLEKRLVEEINGMRLRSLGR